MARPKSRGGRSQSAIPDIDLHGFTEIETIRHLDHLLSGEAWRNLHRVRIIHGTGAILFRTVREWAETRGIVYTLEEHNPGVTILQLRHRPVAAVSGSATSTKPLRNALAAFTPSKVEVEIPKRVKIAEPVVDPQPQVDPADLFAEALQALERVDARQVRRLKSGK